MPILEVCANSLASAIAAQEGGAARVELCDNLAEGGTTPAYAQIALSRKALDIKLYPIIRPRGGDFLYSDLEFSLMKEDIKICKSLGCDGVVFGILRADGTVDEKRCKELLETAFPMKATFHRAFDMVDDQHQALETIINLGFERILTSGQASKAIDAIPQIKALVHLANERIIIMPGAGINKENLKTLVEGTGALEFHATAKVKKSSEMKFRNEAAKMGSNADEYTYEETSAVIVKDLVSILNDFNS